MIFYLVMFDNFIFRKNVYVCMGGVFLYDSVISVGF